MFLQGQEHWEEVFAVLEGGVLSLFKDQAAAEQVLHDTSWASCTPSNGGSGPPLVLKDPGSRRVFPMFRVSASRLRVVFPQKICRWPPIHTGGTLCKENIHYRRKENTFRLTSVSPSQP